MTALVMPEEEELYLLALLDDPSGLDLAEFAWIDEEQEDGCFRAWDVQWRWYSDESTFQVDQCGRSVGKTNGIVMRAFAFPFVYPGQEMLITAPELNHLRPLVDQIEFRITATRLSNEMRPRDKKGGGISRQPHWQVRFANGARIMSRLPGRDGRGVKGQHPIVLEADEMQDYPLAGWTELTETLKRGSKGAQWRAHGVSRGVRDKFYEITQDDSNWTVHRIMAMHRESWGPDERDEKIKQYGGSRQNPDYKRNIYGEHGDATNPVFVLARLMACVDQNEGSEFNTDVYHFARITYEQLQTEDNPTGQPIEAFLQMPGTHKKGHEIAPKGYSAYYAGMDVGVTNHPSEILLFGQRAGKSAGAEHLDLLLRIQMLRVDTGDQIDVVEHLFNFYGAKLLAFGIDSTGLGFPVMQALNRKPFGARVHGYNASEKVTVGVRDPEEGEENLDPEDLAEERNVIEYATDSLRNDYVDPRRLTLPFDREVLTEWQAQNYTVVKGEGSPYGKRKKFSEGEFHTLDAARMMASAKALPAIAEQLKPADPDPVLDVFVGAM